MQENETKENNKENNRNITINSINSIEIKNKDQQRVLKAMEEIKNRILKKQQENTKIQGEL